MNRLRALPLSLAGLLVLISGCIFFPGFAGFTGDSVFDVSSVTDPGQSGRVVNGRVRVEVTNATGFDASCTVRMTLAEQEVHRAARTITPGGSTVIVGPDNAERVVIESTIPAASFSETRTFELGVDFEPGDVLRVVLRLDEPGRKPPLAVAVAGVDADRTVEAGTPVSFAINVTNADEATRFAAFADPDTEPANGNEIAIVTEQAALSANTVTWDTTGVPFGRYELYGEADDDDDERFARSNSAAGAIIVVGPLQVAVGLAEPISVESGDTVTFDVTSSGSTEAGRIDVTATAGETKVTIANALPAAAAQSIEWDTTGVAPGTYAVQATLTDDARSATASGAGLVTILPPLEIAFVELDEDVLVEVGDDVTFGVQTAGTVGEGARFDVRATRQDDPNGLSVPIADGVPAAGLTQITWDTFDDSTEQAVPAGVYTLSATLTDGQRTTQTATAAGRVEIVNTLQIFLLLFADQDVALGTPVEIDGFVGGLTDGGTFAVFAKRVDTEANEPRLLIADDQRGNGGFSVTWETAEVTPGRYRLLAEADDPRTGRSASSGLTQAEITILPPLQVAFLEPGEDTQVDYDEEIPFLIAVGQTTGNATVDVFADNIDTGDKIEVATGLDANGQVGGDWFVGSKSGIPTGSYRLRAEVTDGERTGTATSSGLVIVLEPLFFDLRGVDQNITVAPGDKVPFSVLTANALDPNASFDVHALKLNDEVDPIPVALDVPAEPNVSLVFDTTELLPGRYRLDGVLQDGDRNPQLDVSNGVVIISAPPLLTFTDPNGPVGLFRGDEITFGWAASDAEEDATIDFFLDPDLVLNGNEIPLLEGVSEDSEPTGTATIATDGIDEGNYFLLGVIDDGFSQVPVYAVDVCVTESFFGAFTAEDFPGLLTTISGVTAKPNDPNSIETLAFGSAVDISDLDGDGAGDVAIGDPFAARPVDGLISYGAAWFHRRDRGPWPAALTANDLQMRVAGRRWNEELGASVALLGTFNEDTPSALGEMLVGAPNFDHGKSDDDGRGLFLDGVDVLAPPANLFDSGSLLEGTSGGRLGQTVASAGDVNGDGFGDALLGAPQFDGDRGRVVVVSGAGGRPDGVVGNIGQAFQGSLWVGPEVNDLTGTAIARAGRLDPNRPETGILIGSPGCLNAAGGVFIVPGGPHLTDNATHLLEDVGSIEPGIVVMGSNAGDLLGSSVASGNINGDLYPDYILGAPGAASGSGKVYVIFGGPSLPASISASDIGGSVPGLVVTSPLGGRLGSAVASVPDVDGDGLDELALGAPTYNDDSGIVHLVYGGPDLPPVASLDPRCDLPSMAIFGDFGDRLGASVSGGDIDGDDIGDFAAGAPGINKVYLFFGGDGAPEPCRGDLNGDGRVDLIDLGILLGGFGAAGGVADINDDGVVNLSDLAILLNEFGRLCPGVPAP